MTELLMENLNFKNLRLILIICLISTALAFSQLSVTKTHYSNSLSQSQQEVSQKKTVENNLSLKKWISLSGIWESSIGWKYNVKQKGNKFTWTVINRKQTAGGTIAKNAKDIHVTWKDSGSKGTVKGLILEVDDQGKATFIEWDNGVYFHRK